MKTNLWCVCVLLLSNCTSAGIIQSGTTWTGSYDGTIDSWTAPSNGVYQFTVYGAQGGNSQILPSQSPLYIGGLGSGAEASYYITAGTTLDILVGGQGGFGDLSGGGGGGSFVAVHGLSLANDAPLVIGGGGGAESNYNSLTAGNGRITPGSGGGGSGSAGYRGSGAGGGGGGAGFANSGGNGVTDSQFGYQGGGGGIAFTSGGAGGYGFPTYTYPSGPGGFGGGGGGGEGVDPGGAGGGGGYDGGYAGSGNGGDYPSQGGTAFFAGNPSGGIDFLSGSYLTAAQSGNGSVSFTLESSPTPEPSTLALFGAGALSLVGLKLRRRRLVQG